MASIARLAGVTQPTVSRAFNHPEMLQPETLARIMEAVRQTGYVPNMVASSLVSRKTHLLAAIVPMLSNVVYTSFLRVFSARARDAGYQTMVFESGFSTEEEERLVEMALARRPDGILLTGVSHSKICRLRLKSAAIPVAEVWDLHDNPIDFCVGFSHSKGTQHVADYLLCKGYRRFAVISANDERALSREGIFGAAISAAGLPAALCHHLPGPASIGEGRKAFASLLAQGFDKGAIFCSSDLIAHGVLVEASVRAIDVPGQIAVMGFGDQDFAAQIVPPLTTLNIDRALMGDEAARLLIDRIEGREPENRVVDLGFRIVERATV
ncbi:LacI family DNA-binding transcriptional regulator [Paracoccus aestuariivivens]|uniref:LacI family DNA-binding transcriptional regulator n=2 Tax=Paracoccus aestuariivivens TaxID=1820333 RepID=A0A6L6JCQ2_9RHOB|nr:LacI family DNA-binding transcriptional regulator [Paracoccus aestuariivivens]